MILVTAANGRTGRAVIGALRRVPDTRCGPSTFALMSEHSPSSARLRPWSEIYLTPTTSPEPWMGHESSSTLGHPCTTARRRWGMVSLQPLAVPV